VKPEPINLNDYQDLVGHYHGESERAAIALAGSFVEHYVAHFIRHFMIDDPAVSKLFDGFGPFSTFDQRISTAYAFRLIPVWIRNDLSTIKDIRNRYAHSPKPIRPDDPKISAMFQKLSTACDPAFNAGGDGPLKDRKLIYLFAVARFVVFAHETMRRNPKLPKA
jgi:DNA-binding MltR family transcriptional regulator